MIKTKLKIFLFTFCLLIFISSCCFATEDLTTQVQEEVDQLAEEEQGIIEETSDWTNGDLYVAKDNVTISNVVDGNVFVIADEVTITGTGEIGGDLFVVANKLTVEKGGYIYSSIFACAKEIMINGVVYDVYATCNDFTVGDDGFIYRDMKVMAPHIKIEGTVRRNAYVSTSNMEFGTMEQVYIEGDLHYTNQTEIEIPQTAVGGEVKYSATSVDTKTSVGNIILSYIEDLLQTILFTLVVSLAFVWLSPKFVERVGKMGVAKAFTSLGVGFAAPIAFVLVAIILALSTVGTSLVICGAFIAVVLCYIGFSIASIFFGSLLAKWWKAEGNIKRILCILAASAILWAISQIPILGGLISFVLCLFGIGTTIVNIVWKEEKKEKVQE